MLRYTTDRARPGLVALYDIRPGNGAGQFLRLGARTGQFSGRVLLAVGLQYNSRLEAVRYNARTAVFNN